MDKDRIIDKQKYIVGGYISKKTNKIVKQNIGNVVKSNIIGYFDKKDRNTESEIPCRLTQFNKLHSDKFNNALPLIKKIDKLFKKLIPKNIKNNINKQTKQNLLLKIPVLAL